MIRTGALSTSTSDPSAGPNPTAVLFNRIVGNRAISQWLQAEITAATSDWISGMSLAHGLQHDESYSISDADQDAQGFLHESRIWSKAFSRRRFRGPI
jgi:hypothetical protein